jgi:hypothetical protein
MKRKIRFKNLLLVSAVYAVFNLNYAYAGNITPPSPTPTPIPVVMPPPVPSMTSINSNDGKWQFFWDIHPSADSIKIYKNNRLLYTSKRSHLYFGIQSSPLPPYTNGTDTYNAKACSSDKCSALSQSVTVKVDMSSEETTGKRVVFIHTDILGNPVSETNKQ